MVCATYVLVSPFGLKNHEAMEKTLMKMMLTRIDQLSKKLAMLAHY